MKYASALIVLLCLMLAVVPVQAHGGQEPLTPEERVSSLIHLLGLSLVLGGLVFQAIVSRDHDSHIKLVGIGWGLMGMAGLLILISQEVGGQDIFQRLADPDNLVLGELRFGSVWKLRLLVWLVLGAVLYWMPRQSLMALILATLTAILTEISRHPPSLEDTALLVATDLVIQIAFATVFGLGTQAVSVFQRRPLRLNQLANATCLAALAAVGALMIQGGYPTLIGLQVAALVALCALLISSLFLVGRHPRIWAAQMGLATVTLLLINPFTYSRLLPQTSQLDYQVQIIEGLSASLEIYPALPGQNTVYLTLIDSQIGTRLDDASFVQFAAPLLSSIELSSMGDGVYSADIWIESSGESQASVLIQRPGLADTTLIFSYQIADA